VGSLSGWGDPFELLQPFTLIRNKVDKTIDMNVDSIDGLKTLEESIV